MPKREQALGGNRYKSQAEQTAKRAYALEASSFNDTGGAALGPIATKCDHKDGERGLSNLERFDVLCIDAYESGGAQVKHDSYYKAESSRHKRNHLTVSLGLSRLVGSKRVANHGDCGKGQAIRDHYHKLTDSYEDDLRRKRLHIVEHGRE